MRASVRYFFGVASTIALISPSIGQTVTYPPPGSVPVGLPYTALELRTNPTRTNTTTQCTNPALNGVTTFVDTNVTQVFVPFDVQGASYVFAEVPWIGFTLPTVLQPANAVVVTNGVSLASGHSFTPAAVSATVVLGAGSSFGVGPLSYTEAYTASVSGGVTLEEGWTGSFSDTRLDPYGDTVTQNYGIEIGSSYDIITGVQDFQFDSHETQKIFGGADGCVIVSQEDDQGATSVDWLGTQPITVSIALTLPAGHAGVLYSPAVVVSGGTPPYTISATGFPPGLTVGSDGAISGTPSASDVGVYKAIITASDSAGVTDGPTTTSITIAAAPPPVVPPIFSDQARADYQSAAEKWDLISNFWQIQAPNPACAEVMICAGLAESSAQLSNLSTLTYSVLALESVDLNYKVISPPVIIPIVSPLKAGTLPRDVAKPLLRLIQIAEKQLAYTRAVITADNRYTGAAEAGDSVWKQRQLLAAKSFGFEIARLEREQLKLLFDLECALQLHHAPTIPLSQADLVAELANVAATGFPSATLALLTSAGLTPSDIATLQAEAGKTTATGPLSFPAAIVDKSYIRALESAHKATENFVADRNGDNLVNCADVAIVRGSLGLTKSDPTFDPRADVSGDGGVTLFDLWYVVRQLPRGVSCNGKNSR